MPQEISTREFRITDYQAAINLWTNAEGIEIAEGDSKEGITLFLSQNPGLSRVAEDTSGNVVGAALCGHDGRRGYIYHLAVDPRYQQKGLARKLVSECLDRLRHHGLPRALILVADDNLSGRAFWNRCGWEDVPGALGMGIDL
jgi:N-acetylglutamate synthase